MKVKELIELLQKMPQGASVIIPSGYLKWERANRVRLGIFYPHSMEFVPDSNDEDDANSVLIDTE
ncbi:MAG: hypothetical protein LC122_12495 [Chitinophagales bacterium]|nr:hypothetical protein [Chitinophagales bacterium]